MNNRKWLAFICAAVCLAVTFTAGCSGADEEPVTVTKIIDPTENTKTDSEQVSASNPAGNSLTDSDADSSSDSATGSASDSKEGASQLVWATYWDTDGLKEALENNASDYDAIGFFAAYYDETGRAFIPEGTLTLTQQLKASGLFDSKTSFLTFVNDQTTSSGSKLKDTDLLYSLLGTGELASAHVDEVVALAKAGGYDGIEIDYEAIKKDMTLWSNFLDFIKLLNERTASEGLKLRVLFEPGAPIESFDWPEGPEYVMMCYNLYGFGTRPGPKADPDFLISMADKMETVGTNINFALANGGFDWADNGDIAQITSVACSELISRQGIAPTRDPNSGALYFTYTDDTGMNHTIWYADDETIITWQEVIKSRGHNSFSLWRLP